jgi:hypothetical protein
VTLALIFALLAFALVLLLWGGSMLLQGWLYQAPADRMPLRAAAGGVALAAFLTFWCLLDARNPGKYDTLFEFSPLEITDHDSFDSVMRKTNGSETVTRYHREPGGRGTTNDFMDDRGQHWRKNTSEAMAVEIRVKEKDKPEPARFKANLDEKGNFPKELTQLRYTDADGRYMSADTLGRVYRRKTGVLFANIFLNAAHFLLWWAVFWLGMRFSIWHACGLSLVMWLFVMVALQPVLFNQTRPKEPAATAMLSSRYA